MTEIGVSETINVPQTTEKHWTNVVGAWLGIGTSPGALLIGAGIAQRYAGSIPLLSIFFSFTLMFVLLWYQGKLGLNPPLGEGKNLTEVSERYFGPLMQKAVAALIAIGMIGWFGFNIGLGGAALAALVHIPSWTGPLILGLPILILSLRGLRSWNRMAALTTFAVLILVGFVTLRLSDGFRPVTLAIGSPADLLIDAAVFIGYISVFSVRVPDFTAGMGTRKDLAISDLLLCIPIIFVALAGAGLHMGTGSTDLVAILAGPGGLAIGNLLIAISVIAPTFTTLYSGAPALRASLGIAEKPAMILITLIGLILAVFRFDLQLIAWVKILAAMLPPLVIPLAIESTRRRQGKRSRLIPIWLWLPGALVSMTLSFLEQPLAALVGLVVAFLTTTIWYILDRSPTSFEIE